MLRDRPLLQLMIIASVTGTLLGVGVVIFKGGKGATLHPYAQPQGFCDKMQEIAINSCLNESEENLYQEGAANYSREEKLRDVHACAKIGEAVYARCKREE